MDINFQNSAPTLEDFFYNYFFNLQFFFLAEINGLPEEEAKTLEGTLDTAFLFAYAISMLFFT